MPHNEKSKSLDKLITKLKWPYKGKARCVDFLKSVAMKYYKLGFIWVLGGFKNFQWLIFHVFSIKKTRPGLGLVWFGLGLVWFF